jgi:hypothetical protein
MLGTLTDLVRSKSELVAENARYASAIDHPAAPGEAACLYQDGSDAPGPAGKNGTNLEASPRHCPARDAPAVAPPGLQALLEIQVEGSFPQAKTIPGDYLLDWGRWQGTIGVFGAERIRAERALAGHSRVPAAPFRST